MSRNKYGPFPHRCEDDEFVQSRLASLKAHAEKQRAEKHHAIPAEKRR